MGAQEKYAGKRVRCQKCSHVTLIPEVEQTSSEAKPEQKNVIKFRCPNCNQKIGVKAQYAGQKVRCAKCRKPLRIPSPAAPEIPPDEKEAAAVAESGPEEHFEEEGWGDFSSDFNDLLAAEASAPTIETEQPLNLAPTAEQTASDFHINETQFMETQAIQPPKKKYTGLYIGLGAVAAIVIIGIVLFITMPESPEQKQAKQLDAQEAQKFAEDYINLLVKNDIEKAMGMLNPQLQNSIEKNRMDAFAERVAKGPIREIITATPYIEYQDDKILFYFHFDISYDEKDEQQDEKDADDEFNWQDFQMDWQYLILVVSKTEFEMKIEELALYNSVTGNAVSLGPTPYNQLSEIALTAEMEEVSFILNIFGRFFCGILVAVAILGLLNLVSMWIVFDKAGEPGWAILIPFYNMWVLAKVGDKPGWEGLAICFAGGVPFIGIFIEIYLWVDISIGVARTFDKGILFGLGLFILPFIFYPILAFTD
jgi:hypothetical protein